MIVPGSDGCCQVSDQEETAGGCRWTVAFFSDTVYPLPC
jgi:hypothetical protein